MTSFADPGNPANIYEALGLENVIGEMHDAAGVWEPQRYPANYSGMIDGNTRYVFPVPGQVWRLRCNQLGAKACMETKFPHVIRPAVMDGMNMSEAQRAIFVDLERERMVREGVKPVSSEENSMDRLAAAAEAKHEEFRAMGGSEYDIDCRIRDWELLPSSIEEFSQAFFSGAAAEKVTEMARWIQAQGSMVDPLRAPLDTELSYFGNFVAQSMLDLEEAYGIKAMHAEVFKVWVGVHGAYQMAKTMKTNFLFSGPAAAGKSYLGNVVRKSMIPPGVVVSVTRDTTCANQTIGDKVWSETDFRQLALVRASLTLARTRCSASTTPTRCRTGRWGWTRTESRWGRATPSRSAS